MGNKKAPSKTISSKDLEKFLTDPGTRARTIQRSTRRQAIIDNPASSPEQVNRALRDELQAKEGIIHELLAQTSEASVMRDTILGLSQAKLTPPNWMVERRKSSGKTKGIPTIFASDWHYGEIVHKAQINGMNEFNLDIADRRIKALVDGAVNLLFDEQKEPIYDGIVFAMGGDMFSGVIHEELKETNEKEMFPTLLQLTERVEWVITNLAKQFGRVHVPVVVGNHGRTSRKPVAKNRAFQNFDWLLGSLLASRFRGDKRITFQIPEGPDAQYSIYGHRYLLTHGDQFRGGDGIIGPIGSVIRGNHRKTMRESNINKPYDTLICGHWHQLIMTEKIIINGALKGYDEYAYTNNFEYQDPQQAMWLTHPEHGITISMPIFLDKKRKTSDQPLVWENGTQLNSWTRSNKVASPIRKVARRSPKRIKKNRSPKKLK